jgi:hypothetical protein
LQQIANPWHSRPIDVHRWSDHPEAIRLAEILWAEHFWDYADETAKTGPKPKTSFKNQLKILILDLYVAWLEDPELCIGVPMAASTWDTNSRYNALHLSKKITDLVRRLHEQGMLDLAKGSYSGPYASGNRNTRIRASKALQDLFRGAKLREADIQHHRDEECLILKDNDDDDGSSHLVEYADTPATLEMRRRLRAYNDLLARTFIDIPALEEPIIDTGGVDANRVLVGPSRKFVRRIFNRGSWGLNGRYYGGWWQQVGKTWRSQIFINDVPTVEVDFKGLHMAILSAEKGQPFEGDPYELPENTLPGTSPDLQRTVLKRLLLTAVNARDTKSAFRSFRDGFPAGHYAKSLTNEELTAFLAAFTKKHPHLEDTLCSDQGIRLMNVDAQIAQRVLDHFTPQGLPVLCIHDSFIVPYTHVRPLKAAMGLASRAVVGVPLAVEASAPGLDEMRHRPLDVQQDYVAWMQSPRCGGYLSRLEDHEERQGSAVAVS